MRDLAALVLGVLLGSEMMSVRHGADDAWPRPESMDSRGELLVGRIVLARNLVKAYVSG